MTDEMRLMRETIDSQYTEICNLNRNTEALHQEIRNLKKENDALREQLAKYETPDKNSPVFRKILS
jgi:cell division protein FtsB